jgi:hypothetical protein
MSRTYVVPEKGGIDREAFLFFFSTHHSWLTSEPVKQRPREVETNELKTTPMRPHMA